MRKMEPFVILHLILQKYSSLEHVERLSLEVIHRKLSVRSGTNQ